jgi:hypothetical protein
MGNNRQLDRAQLNRTLENRYIYLRISSTFSVALCDGTRETGFRVCGTQLLQPISFARTVQGSLEERSMYRSHLSARPPVDGIWQSRSPPEHGKGAGYDAQNSQPESSNGGWKMSWEKEPIGKNLGTPIEKNLQEPMEENFAGPMEKNSKAPMEKVLGADFRSGCASSMERSFRAPSPGDGPRSAARPLPAPERLGDRPACGARQQDRGDKAVRLPLRHRRDFAGASGEPGSRAPIIYEMQSNPAAIIY